MPSSCLRRTVRPHEPPPFAVLRTGEAFPILRIPPLLASLESMLLPVQSAPATPVMLCSRRNQVGWLRRADQGEEGKSET